MIIFLNLLKNIIPYLKYIVFAIVVIILFFMLHNKNSKLSELDQNLKLYQRQASGQLTEKEALLEAANSSLGISQSKLMEQKDIVASFNKENIKLSSDFENFKKKNNLILEAYQHNIAQIEQQLKNVGATIITVGTQRNINDPKPDSQFNSFVNPAKEKLVYSWDSGDGRFKLTDADIFSSASEKTFIAKQVFRVDGEIYKEKTGFLKTQRLSLEEIVEDGKNIDGTIKYKVVNTAKIIDSKFNYSEAAPDTFFPHKGVIGIWPTLSVGLSLANGLNPHLVVGTGIDWISYKGIGTGVNAYIDTTVINQSSFGVDITYRPTILQHQLNVGAFVGIATEFVKPFNSYDVIGGVKVYIW